MKKNQGLFVCLILFLLLLLTAGGCRKKEEAPGDTINTKEQAPVKEDASRAIQMNRPGEDSKTAPPEETRKKSSFPESKEIPSFSGPLFMQRQLPQSRILPEGDYTGPFLDYFSADETRRQAGNVLKNFFFSFQAGIVDRRFLVADGNRLFMDELETYKTQGPRIIGYSAGSLQLSGNRGSVRVRIFSETGSLTGRIYLVYDGERWLLEDWEIPFSLWPGENSIQESADLQSPE